MIENFTKELAMQRRVSQELRRSLLHVGLLLGARGGGWGCGRNERRAEELDVPARAEAMGGLEAAKILSTDRMRCFRGA